MISGHTHSYIIKDTDKITRVCITYYSTVTCPTLPYNVSKYDNVVTGCFLTVTFIQIYSNLPKSVWTFPRSHNSVEFCVQSQLPIYSSMKIERFYW